MIASIDDAQEALAYIQTENPNLPKEITERMDANSFNASLYAIENQLDILYEKIRLIEDLDDFVRRYVKAKIKEKESRLRDSLKIIEDVSDLYTDTSSVSILVPLVRDESTIYDRDGSIVPPMAVVNGSLTMNTSAASEAKISSITRQSSSPCYASSYDNLLKGESGSSLYYDKNRDSNNLTENITVDFYEPSDINYVEVIPVNCVVSDLKGILPDQTEISLENGYFPQQKLSGLKFTLSSSNYVNTTINANDNSFDTTAVFGNELPQTRWIDKQLIKDIERSMEDADKKYNVSILENIYDSYAAFNDQAARKNIKVGGK
jgi:hypothetical protein